MSDPSNPLRGSLPTAALAADGEDTTRSSRRRSHGGEEPSLTRTGPSAPTEAELRQAGQVGRFFVLGPLGEGGAATVWLAYDPALDRRLALKFLRLSTRADDPAAAEARLRLQREAQAMARLAHPGVVQVFDVGEHHGTTFVAMEFVAGGTLRAWCSAEQRPWRRVVEAYLAAGEGLRAAHEAGLIHRDFKPDNVLIDPQGRPKVGDFGLAHLPAPVADAREAPLDVTRLTVGTPAYMPPEQFRGEPADARSDQFAFCASLWEALFGERPFAGNDYVSLEREVLAGRLRLPADLRGVPLRVRQVLTRGLASDPAERHRDMGRLLARLRRAANFSPGRLAAGLIGGLAIAGLVGGLGATFWRQQTRCQRETEARSLRSLMEPGGALREVLSRLPAGEEREQVERWLEASGGAWERERLEVCHRVERDPTWGPRLNCLDEEVGRVRGLVELAGGAPSGDDVAAVSSYLLGHEQLGSSCPLPDVRQHAALDSTFLAREARLGPLADLGRIDQQLHEAERLRDDAADAGLRSMESAALGMVAGARISSGDALDQADRDLSRSVRLADAAGDDLRRTQALFAQAILRLSRSGQSEVDVTVEELRSSVERMGSPPFWLAQTVAIEASLDTRRAGAEPEALMRRAVELFRPVAGPRSPVLASLVNDLGNLVGETPARADEALAIWREAEAIALANQGPHGVDAFVMRMNMAVTLSVAGRYAEALQKLELAGAAYRLAPDPQTPNLVWLDSERAWALQGLGRLEEALVALDRADKLDAQVAVDDRDPAVESALSQHRAVVMRKLGRWAEAEHAAVNAYDEAVSRHGGLAAVWNAQLELVRILQHTDPAQARSLLIQFAEESKKAIPGRHRANLAELMREAGLTPPPLPDGGPSP